MTGLCNICYSSNIETFFSKKSGLPICKDCAIKEAYGVKQ